MNTPAHAMVNLWLLGRKDRADQVPVILLGGVLPDLPMFLFYGWQKGRGMTEQWIWSEGYFDSRWQAFFDVFNSLPLILLGLMLAWKLDARRWLLLFSSMALHVAGDLPLHNDDAHRHFFPLSDWRFHSPLSYWDPQHHGQVVSMLEAALVVLCGVVVWRTYSSRIVRLLAGGCVAIYGLYWGFAFWMWI